IVWFDHFFYYDDIEKPDIIPSTILEGYGLNHSGIISLKYWLDRTAYIKQNSFCFGWHGMINFNYLKFIKLKFLDKISHEDHYFAKLLFFQSKYIFVLLKKLYFYRQRTDSIMSSIENPNLNSLAPYNNYIYKELKDIKLTRQYYRHSSLFLTAAMVFKFIEENQDKQYIEIFQYIFSEKLKLWRNEILHFPEKCLGFILYDTFFKLINFSNSAEYTLRFISDFFKDVIIDNSLYNKNLYDQIELRDLELVSKANKILNLENIIQEKENIIQEKEKLLSFQTKYGTAKFRIQNQLSYKLGQAMIVNSKSFLGYIRMPFVLSYIRDKHKQEQKIYQEKIKKDPSLKLPSLEQYPDYQEALKEKECFTYKLGQAFIQANKNWYGGGYIKLWFEIRKLKREIKQN
ncbi:glycosyltransferase family 2 protein, partial [Campylobacter insulaenigrae]|uniref:glycosyltransferase family 2 protein n=1 Tax=Campylobacter insulaenigrae TaxID=260714 RepID=UPI0021528BEE